MRKIVSILAFGFTVFWLAFAVNWLATGPLDDRDPATGKPYAKD